MKYLKTMLRLTIAESETVCPSVCELHRKSFAMPKKSPREENHFLSPRNETRLKLRRKRDMTKMAFCVKLN